MTPDPFTQDPQDVDILKQQSEEAHDADTATYYDKTNTPASFTQALESLLEDLKKQRHDNDIRLNYQYIYEAILAAHQDSVRAAGQEFYDRFIEETLALQQEQLPGQAWQLAIVAAKRASGLEEKP